MTKERRQFPRVRQPFEVSFRLRGHIHESWKPAVLLNLSAGGMRFDSEALLETGQALELRLTLPTLKGPLVVLGSVAWSQLRAAGVTEYGVAFEELSPDQQIAIDGLVAFLLKRSSPPVAPPPG